VLAASSAAAVETEGLWGSKLNTLQNMMAREGGQNYYPEKQTNRYA
jgi:hypothetical protein